MRNFSSKFSSLIESMKSESPIKEAKGGDRTASGMKVKKVERKQETFEDKFMSGGKFKMNAFIKSLELLRDQIVAEISSILNTSSSKSYGAKYYKPILGSMDSVKNNVIDLIKTAYAEARKEGGKYEKEQEIDQGMMQTFRDQYSEFLRKYQDASKQWEEAKLKDLKERPVDQDNKGLEDKIKDIKALFDGARQLILQSTTASAPSASAKPGETKIGIESTIKQRNEPYGGKEGETIKEVKKLIYQKFKKYDQLTATSDWKIVFKTPENPGPTLRANTANLIKALKVGLSKSHPELSSDKTGDITASFVKILSELKEGRSINSEDKIISFDSFMEARVTEQFDVNAAAEVLKSTDKPKAVGGNADRVKEKEKEKDKEEDKEKDKEKEEPKEKEKLSEQEAEKIAKEADELLLKANEKIQSFYANPENFSEYTAQEWYDFNDNEEAAVEYIFGDNFDDKTSWFYKNIRKKYTKPAYSIVKRLKESGEKYEDYYISLESGLKKIIGLYGILKKKTYGGTANDKHKWSYTNLEGEKSNYSVDTDFG